MTLNKIQRRMTRIMKDLNAVTNEIEDRAFDAHVRKLDRAADLIGDVAKAFVDDLDAIP